MSVWKRRGGWMSSGVQSVQVEGVVRLSEWVGESVVQVVGGEARLNQYRTCRWDEGRGGAERG